jgi:hypothetical protein
MEFTGHALMRILQRRDFYRELLHPGEKKKPLSTSSARVFGLKY